ncbi:ribose transport system permease protein [Sporobacter termitidis DSM 10068]|uniref:Ribose transport system permease protein n=1 Tax=Sporobacter termitidis DSM 10068 TaxID=1123282 RepID=A0A1M5UJA1_9FIRM|nr:ABC transporter permease [Sporobacter termitidis]SHH62978.1 ribose transport system permease protein [Sporobacter termitidis DSM 10068]
MGKLKKHLNTKTFGLIVATIVLIVIVELINPSFLAKGNVRNLLNTLSFQGVMLAPMAILLMSGNIDLSAGGVAALGSLVFALILQAVPGMPWGVALLLALATGAVIGFINVFFMNVVNLMPFIVTIGTSAIFGGFATVITRGNAVPVNVQSFLNLGKVAVFGVVPLFFIVMVAIVLIHSFVLYKTRFGRSIYMVGGNPYAARLCGLDIKKTRAILFISSGVVSTFSGIIWVCLRKQSNPSSFTVVAPNMQALIATLLGGVSFMGGAGGMGGAFVGLLLLNVFTTGLAVLKAPAYVSVAVSGLLLIVALIFDNLNAMRMRRILMAAAIKEGAKKKTAA